jgi:MFS family permease
LNSTCNTAASWGDLLSSRNALRSIALTGGVALHAINVHIVTTILPSVVREIGGLEYYAWNTTLFVVASILGSALTARLLDALTPRMAYLSALAIFTFGAASCAAAPTMIWMLLGRSVQGLGGGMLAALSYALIHVVFEQRLWARAVALVSGMWGVATLFGPAVGGLFAESGNWRLAFWILLPISAVQALIVATQLTNHKAKGREAIRVPMGKILLLATSALAIAAAALVPQTIWKVAGVAVGLALGIAVARLDSRSRVRLLPTGSYSLHSQLGKIFACVCLLTIGTTTEIFVPYFLQVIHGHPPLVAGYMTAAMAAGWSVASVVGSGRSDMAASRMVRTGPLVMTLSLGLLALILPATWQLPMLAESLLITLALAGAGLGVGLGWPHLLTRALKSAPTGEENLASASITTVQLYAMAIGAAMAGLAVNAAGLSQPGGMEGAQHAASYLFATFALAPALAIFLARGFART